jgi:hypothetical protein
VHSYDVNVKQPAAAHTVQPRFHKTNLHLKNGTCLTPQSYNSPYEAFHNRVVDVPHLLLVVLVYLRTVVNETGRHPSDDTRDTACGEIGVRLCDGGVRVMRRITQKNITLRPTIDRAVCKGGGKYVETRRKGKVSVLHFVASPCHRENVGSE